MTDPLFERRYTVAAMRYTRDTLDSEIRDFAPGFVPDGSRYLLNGWIIRRPNGQATWIHPKDFETEFAAITAEGAALTDAPDEYLGATFLKRGKTPRRIRVLERVSPGRYIYEVLDNPHNPATVGRQAIASEATFTRLYTKEDNR